MPGKINVYNLGSKGVNVVKSPVHLADGELTSAQNVQIDAVKSLGGIRKRDGMTRLNSSVMTGSGNGIINLPLPDRSTYVRRFFVPYDYGGGAILTNTFWESTDGATWTAGTRGATPQQLATSNLGLINGSYRWCVHRNRLYYPANDGYIHVLDGDSNTDYKLLAIPRNPRDSTGPIAVLSIVPYSSTYLIVSTYDSTGGGGGRGRVFLMNVTNGQLTQLGAETDLGTPGVPVNAFVYNGRIWVSLFNGSGGSAGRIYYCRPGDATWTLDETFAATKGYIYQAAPFLGELYAGLGSDVGAAGFVSKRDKDTAWASVKVTDGTGAGNHMGPLAVSQDGLTIYSWWHSSNGASPIFRIMKSTDGVTWTQDFNAGDVSNSNASPPWVDTNGDMYWVLFNSTAGAAGQIVRNVGGVYTAVKTATNQFGGPISALLMPT